MPDNIAPLPAVPADLLARSSVPARLLRAPAPDRSALDLAVSAALRAPDHGGLRPWRFVFIQGEDRGALGDLLAASMRARAPDTPAERLEVERAKPLRAPLVVAAGAAINHERPGVPPWEQEASAAAGIMNFLNMLDAQGFGACWLSSPSLKDPAVKAALGFAEGDSLLGWIYAGTPGEDRPRPSRPGPDAFRRDWAPGR
ncbi:nitroreductase [Roseococcus sp. SYP-B2431]|uniref:nitroreductase family protein n=1 Tax=Roseococcus sp. SYP-B2431 TaxID=2496640 RepID=UPI0013F3B3F2|nr:nitroreductase [Roseococcus sp. SYP-B2431]